MPAEGDPYPFVRLQKTISFPQLYSSRVGVGVAKLCVAASYRARADVNRQFNVAQSHFLLPVARNIRLRPRSFTAEYALIAA